MNTPSPSADGRPLSRRAFLRRAGAVSAAAGATGLLGISVLAPRPTNAGVAVGRGQHPLAKAHDASTAVAWIETLYDATMRENITPTNAARTYAYAAVALYQSVLGGMPGRRSLAGQLNGLSTVPRADPRLRYDWPAAANGALSVIAARIYPTAGAETVAAVAAQRQAQVDARASRVAPDVLARSLAHGELVGNAVMDWAAADGLSSIRALPTYVPPTGVDRWESTPPNFGPAIEPYWGQMRPFALPAADECFPPPPIPFDTDPASAFHAQAKHVWDISQGLTDEQRSIAMFWRDNPLTSGLPAGHWFIIANQLTDQLELRLDDAAEMYALLGVALTDAFISCWHGKYIYNLLRPVTYVRRYIDPTWVTWVNTPQFPEYTSGHSVSSQAAAVVLTELFGDATGFTDTHHLLPPSPSAGTRTFPSFAAAALEAATSRLYGGIHYPMGVEVGMEQGTKVGNEVLRRVKTRLE